jgi:amino acid transporter
MELLSTVLAFSAPVSTVYGYIPFVIVFDGLGAPGAFLAAMALLLVFSVGFTTMSRHVPNPGAFYAYITAGLGRIPGLGAALLAVFGYLLLGFCVFPFFGVSANALISETFHGPEIPWYWYALACWAACGTLSYHRIDLSARVLSIAMALEIIIVLVFDVAVFVDGGPQHRSLQPFYWSAFTSGAVGIAVLFAATTFLGFEATAIFRAEVKQPDKTIPRATYLAVVLIGVFYTVSAWMQITAYGVGRAVQVANADPSRMFPVAMGQFVGSGGVDVARILLVSSLFAAVLSGQNILARYLFSLGVDGVLPRALAVVHRHHASPYVATLIVSVIWLLAGSAFVLNRTNPLLLYARVAGVGGFSVLILLLLTSISVVVFFRRSPHVKVSTLWHTLIAPIIAAIGLAFVVGLAIEHFELLIGGSRSDALLLQAVTWGVLLAGMALAAVYKRTRPEVYLRIGARQL